MSYTGKAFLYIEDGEVVVNPELMPELTKDQFIPDNDEENRLIEIHHEFDLTEWETQHIKVENAHVSKHPIEGNEEITITKPVWQIVGIGQPCHIENGKVVKLLT